MRAPLLLAVLALLAAGCAAPDADVATQGVARDASWAERTVPYGDAHDHHDPAQHANLSTPNFELLGWDPLVTDHQGRTAGGYFCGDVATTGEGRRVAVVASYSTDVAFVVVDVTDPAAPRKLGEYVLERAQTYDVALTPDGRHVVVGTNVGDTGPDGGPGLGAQAPVALVQPKFRDACTGETRAVGPEQALPMAPMLLLVSIEDPMSPTLVDQQALPVIGPHSVSTGTLAGRTVVGASVTNLVHQASYFAFYEVAASPLGGEGLSLLSVYQAPPSTEHEVAVINGHVDVSFLDHPVTGQPLAYLANWDGGMSILDMSDPRAPTLLSTFSEFTGGAGYMVGVETGNLHETLPIEGTWDGRHYVLAGQEILSRPPDHPSGWVWIIDDTDPAAPQLVGRWTIPVEAEWEETLQFSTHYLEVVDRTLFVSHYHAGVWAVDLSTPERLAEPAAIGVFMPDRVSPSPPPSGASHGVTGFPCVLDVLAFPDGDLAVYEASSGVYVVRFDASRPMAPVVWEG